MLPFLSPGAFSVLLLTLVINGCGTGNHAGATGRSSPTATPAATTAGASATSAPSATAPASPGAAHATATGPSRAPATTATTGASNVRLPATFVITGPRTLNPSAVAAPAGVTIELTVVSADHRSHRLTVRTSPAHTLAIPAGGRASAALTGLKAGRYELQVDGGAAGSLTIGAQPGP